MAGPPSGNNLKSPPGVLVIFGATGNLSHTKLIPSLYELESAGLLDEKTKIIAVARRDLHSPDYVASLVPNVEKYSRSFDQKVWEKFSKKILFQQADFNEPKDFAALKEILDQLENESKVCLNRIFYLATAPSFFPLIFEALKNYRMNKGCEVHDNPSRIVIEKPFGRDLKSAKDLNAKLDQVFSEDQIYRIDHYLAKETVQNILAFRFANEIFEPILNNQYVDNIQIVQTEDLGVEGRGEYYEEAGGLRDFIQNHLLQLLAITTMDEPKKFEAEAIREEKVKILEQVQMIRPEEVKGTVVRGQYGPGQIDDHKVVGYRQEEEVGKESTTETFVAMKLFINNDCWKGVPIYLKHGKRMEKKLATITIQFKEAGHALFAHLEKKPAPNLLTFQLQPDEGIGIRLVAKKPGLKTEIADVDMEFCYASAFREPLPDAYERLLLDIMLGDQTLFPHVKEVIRSWEIVDHILRGWEKLTAPAFPNYASGSWGPKEADRLIEKDGRSWLAHELKICQLHYKND